MPRPAPPLAPPSPAALLLLPLSVLADGALFWPAACLVAIEAAVARRPDAMLIWYGLAVGFDVNALVLAPFVVALCVRLQARWQTASLAPASALAMLLARSHGVPLDDLPQGLALTNGAPTVWAIAQALPSIGTLPLTGLALTSALGASVAYAAWTTQCRLDRGDMLDAALLAAMLPILWPAIAPHAFLLAVVLALLLAVRDPRERRVQVAGLVAAGTMVAWLAGPSVAPLAAVALVAATLLHARAMLKPAANDNPRFAAQPGSRPLPSRPETC